MGSGTPIEENEPMCRPVQCRRCGKTTWEGCGDHVDEVRARVAPEDWCEGHPHADPGAGRRSRLFPGR
jgi:hypothetical protein